MRVIIGDHARQRKQTGEPTAEEKWHDESVFEGQSIKRKQTGMKDFVLNAYLILTTWRMSKMSAKCDMCGKMTKKYFTTYAGDILCSKTCKNAYLLASYLLRMEGRRQKDETNNQRAFQQAREMAAWLSVYKCGNSKARAIAAKAINAWAY